MLTSVKPGYCDGFTGDQTEVFPQAPVDGLLYGHTSSTFLQIDMLSRNCEAIPFPEEGTPFVEGDRLVVIERR